MAVIRGSQRCWCRVADEMLQWKSLKHLLRGLYSLLVMQCSAGRSLFFRRPCRTDRTDGLWTSCSTNKCDCNKSRTNALLQPASMHPYLRISFTWYISVSCTFQTRKHKSDISCRRNEQDKMMLQISVIWFHITSHASLTWSLNDRLYIIKGHGGGILTQQHAVTVIWMVFLPGWHTCFRWRGLWDVLFSPLSIVRGVALTLTWTEAGQLVFICRSSWW